jgi:hypothetical protein
MINNASNQPIFLASTSKLRRTLKSDFEEAAKTKLFKATEKNICLSSARNGFEEFFGIIVGVT